MPLIREHPLPDHLLEPRRGLSALFRAERMVDAPSSTPTHTVPEHISRVTDPAGVANHEEQLLSMSLVLIAAGVLTQAVPGGAFRRMSVPCLGLGNDASNDQDGSPEDGHQTGQQGTHRQRPRPGAAAIHLPDLDLTDSLVGEFDYLHLFVTTQDDMRHGFPKLKEHLRHGGMLWFPAQGRPTWLGPEHQDRHQDRLRLRLGREHLPAHR